MRIGGLQPFTLSDYPGYCAAIIFTIGCNFNCSYCHNKILNGDKFTQINEEQIFEFLCTKQKKLDGIVITGGEPTIQEDLEDFIKKIKLLNFKVKLDTNGSNPDMLENLIKNKLVDCIAMDIKAPFEIYDNIVGIKTNIENIKNSPNTQLLPGRSHVFHRRMQALSK